MALKEYHKKRDFSKTKEPKSGKSDNKSLRFVIQRHHASRLHYDFRLELDGVLKSWAVPKGPSLNPKDKRLAMMVEDHPYDYKNFEGTIPMGHYGGGTVSIFDSGTYKALDADIKSLRKGLKEGNLKFSLSGKKIKGEFALVKIQARDGEQDNAWLLIKHRDKYATDTDYDAEDHVRVSVKKAGIAFKEKARQKEKEPEPEPKKKSAVRKPAREEKVADDFPDFKPMLATLTDSLPPDADDLVFEKKYDGYRIGAAVKAGDVKLITRNGQNYTEMYQTVAKSLATLGADALIDGEMVAEDAQGNSRFQALQNYDASESHTRLRYYAFDLLYLNGHDLTGLPLLKRKDLLKALLAKHKSQSVKFSDHVSDGGKLFETASREGWEGIIGKRNEVYRSGKRSESWMKIKLNRAQEAIIIGYTKPEGGRKYFRSLVLGMNQGDKLVYIGNCGSGFSDQGLKDLHQRMEKLAQKEKPVSGKVTMERKITWLKPELVCEVTFSEWTADGHLRHPVFKGLRADKQPGEVKKEQATGPAKALAKEESSEQESSKQKAVKKETPQEETLKFGTKTVKLTNLQKIYWPKEKISKGTLLDYYRSVAQTLLPYLKDKPLSLNRHPNGIAAPGFFQKDLDTETIPKWIRYAPMFSESTGKDVDYLICNDEATLLWMVNLGCIEINPWLSTHKKPDEPQFAVFDIDPHDIEFIEAVRVAQTAHRILGQMGITAYIKTSGSKGLHIFIPLKAGYTYDQSKDFVHYLATKVLAEHPDTTSLERSPSKRKNKIYLDYLQNRRGQTIAAPYSARPKPHATVSAPLEWSEVNDDLDLRSYTIFNMAQRLEEKGDLWKDILKTRNNLQKALKTFKDSQK